MMKNLSLNSRIFFLLAFMLVQLCLPMQAVHAATTATTEAYAVLSTDKKTLTFYYDTNKNSRPGTIYTSSNFRTSESNGWGGSASTITTVTFNSSFSSYTGLTSTAYWFRGMENLTSISGLSYLNTSNVTSMRDMFYDCKSLTSLYLSNFNTAKVTSMWNMFRNCKSLTSLNLSSFNTSSTTYMDRMFYGCEGLTSLNLSGFNTGNVTDMSYMFDGCSSLTSLNLSGFNTARVANMMGMFDGCSSLTSLNLSGFNTASVAGMSFMFYGCSSLTSLNLSGFNTASVTDMSFMFCNCSSLTSLYLSGFNTGNVTDMSYMFEDCSGLTSLDLSGFNTGKVTNMFGMFKGCSSLTSLDLNGFNTGNVKYMYYMFDGCSGLTSLDLSGFNTGNVTEMSYMFRRCSSLTSLNLSGFNTGNVTKMSYMFYRCNYLNTILVSDQWATNSVNSSGYMFNDCSSLVGDDGTTYDANYTDKTKAYAGRGGYLTLKLEDDLQYYLNSLTDTEDSFVDGVYTRQFQNWDWQALYVPFSMDYSDWQARFEVASIGQLSSEDGVYYLDASIMEDGSTVQPNTPYLIRAKAKAASKLKVTPDNVVDEEENVFALQSTQELGWLVASITGVYTTQPVWYSSNTSSDIYNYRMLGGALSIPTNDDEVLPPNRWYLTLDSRVQPSQVRVRIIDTEATAISDPVCQQDLVNKDVNYAIYDMQGRKVAAGSEATDRLRKGLYIINNKKRMVK